MKKEQCKVKLKIETGKMAKQFSETATAFENLAIALNKLAKKKWWQFWK